MSNNVYAVIAALKITLEEAEQHDHYDEWKVEAANRWINQLPGAWLGRWRHLKISGDIVGDVSRDEFVGHVRATIAYLEVNQESIEVMGPWSWSMPSSPVKASDEPIDAEFSDVTPAKTNKLPQSRKTFWVVK